MLFNRDMLEQVTAGRVTVALRRWEAPPVKAGSVIRTAAGILAITKVERIAPTAIRERDIEAAGFRSRTALLRDLGKDGGPIHRVTFRRLGDDPLAALRKDAKLTKKEMKSVIAALNRLDQASPHGAWTRTILRLIDKYPARRAPDLAASLGREPALFQHDVKKLKDLGLTEVLEVGYRLSPRGRVVLAEMSEPTY